MEPRLADGSVALFRTRVSSKGKAARRGDVVLVDHPELGMIVKKVYAVSQKNQYHLESTKRISSSEEKAGSVDHSRIKGVMLAKLF